MAKHSLLSRLKRFWRLSHHNSTKGFTLLELLVVTAIAGGIVAGLMFIVLQLMTADQRESSRSETHREMQMALDYMSAELREAVYVYTGDYLACAGGQASCQPLTNYLAASVSDGGKSVPVLAFWKQQPFPKPVIDRCAAGATIPNTDCLKGQSYALVVYSLAKNDQAANSTWKGKARITRYVLSQFDSNGNANVGYVDPAAAKDNFATWPFGVDDTGSTTSNLQSGRPADSPSIAPTLVDFVDDGVSAQANANQAGQCPTGTSGTYNISPPTTLLPSNLGRSFYACVSIKPLVAGVAGAAATQDLGFYQDVVLYLRGNAARRPGILPNPTSPDAEISPTLETRVLSRSVLARKPQ